MQIQKEFLLLWREKNLDQFLCKFTGKALRLELIKSQVEGTDQKKAGLNNTTKDR